MIWNRLLWYGIFTENFSPINTNHPMSVSISLLVRLARLSHCCRIKHSKKHSICLKKRKSPLYSDIMNMFIFFSVLNYLVFLHVIVSQFKNCRFSRDYVRLYVNVLLHQISDGANHQSRKSYSLSYFLIWSENFCKRV